MPKILVVHNRYRQAGGEDAVFERESELLRQHGYQVETLEVSNTSIRPSASPITQLRLAFHTVWSASSAAAIRDRIDRALPDVVHFHNTFPQLSPSVYWAACQRSAVVQTLHNYRLLCPSATLFRGGHVCQDCIGRTPPFPGVIHGCYRDSRAQTGVVAAMLTTHRLARTYSHRVDRYIALTEFSRQKFIEGGLPASKIIVKPNFVLPPSGLGRQNRPHMLFVGRLAEEKGIHTLLSAQPIHRQQVRVAGDGPLWSKVSAPELAENGLVALGRLDPNEVTTEMLSARALVFPSEWYEGFPMTLVEAFSTGLPVIASRLGSMAEIVDDGVTGLLFDPGNADDLAAKVSWAMSHPREMREMGENARRTYEDEYTPERNFDMLADIYDQAISQSRSSAT